MNDERLSRKLAVILHADVVGSTGLVQRNETVAHGRISNTFEAFSKTISKHGGVAREIRGDALVAEFERASDAVAASLEFQRINLESNAQIDDGIQPVVRIGISMGEIIVANNTMTGEGVVLAQRLEQLATPGGIVVQGSVADTVPTRMPFVFNNLGEHTLKGFETPVRAFTVEYKYGDETKAETINAISEPQKLSPASYEALTGERLELPDKPSIAVLAFQNMSGDVEQDFFADGISEDIITTLSRVSDLVVIARNSTFVYKGRAVDVRQVGEDLGVRHVLEGSVRKSGDRIRISAQLVDAITGDHVWAERFDRKVDDIFEIQDEITQNIVAKLKKQLVTGEWATTSTNSVEAWELVMRGQPLVESLSRDNVRSAKKLFGHAIELDPNYSSAWVGLGWVHWMESIWNWCPDSQKSMQIAMESCQKSIDLEPRFAEGHSLLAHIFLSQGNADQALEMAKVSFELAPNDCLNLANYADILIELGQTREGLRIIKKVLRLCPFPAGWFLMMLGIGSHLEGDNEIAVKAFNLAIEREPTSHLPRLWLASALVELNRPDEAQALVEPVLEIEPDFSTSKWTGRFLSDSHASLKENLLRAGFPE